MSKGTITWISADKPPKDAETVLVWFSDDDAVTTAEYQVEYKCWHLRAMPDGDPIPRYWARINAPQAGKMVIDETSGFSKKKRG